MSNYFKLKNKKVILVICRHNKSKFLLLKISDKHPYCPGDWDFIFSQQKFINENNAISITKKYTALKIDKIKKFKQIFFNDFESKIKWGITTFLADVADNKVVLDKKYSTYKWLDKKKIIKYDRENYLENILINTKILSKKKIRNKNWFEEYFNLAYVWGDNNNGYNNGYKVKRRLKKRTQDEVNGIINFCKLNKNSKILDLCCGYGRHSIRLASLGYKNITAVDINNFFIQLANYRAKNGLDVYENKTFDKTKTNKINFIKGDVREEIEKMKKFDCILNMFFSFGYFKHKKNLKLIKKIYNHLKDGGCLLMHLFISKNFLSNTKYLEKTERNVNKTKIFNKIYPEAKLIYKKFFDKKTNIFSSIWQIKIGKKLIPNKPTMSKVRIYSIKQMDQILNEAGFKKTFFYSDWKGTKINKKSKDLIILAIK